MRPIDGRRNLALSPVAGAGPEALAGGVSPPLDRSCSDDEVPDSRRLARVARGRVCKHTE